MLMTPTMMRNRVLTKELPIKLPNEGMQKPKLKAKKKIDEGQGNPTTRKTKGMFKEIDRAGKSMRTTSKTGTVRTKDHGKTLPSVCRSTYPIGFSPGGTNSCVFSTGARHETTIFEEGIRADLPSRVEIAWTGMEIERGASWT
jgi:hypothetical protein